MFTNQTPSGLAALILTGMSVLAVDISDQIQYFIDIYVVLIKETE